MEEFDTNQLQGLMVRIKAGERQAREELITATIHRLERLARRMLRQFPLVDDLTETGDVLQSSLMRLLTAVEVVTPENTRAFLGLAGVQVRRVLLDLARTQKGRPRALSFGRAGGASRDDSSARQVEPADSDADRDLERWEAFHEAVERLEAEEREVVSLHFYHGWTQKKIAELFGKDERTIRRWWHNACLKLHRQLGGELPIT